MAVATTTTSPDTREAVLNKLLHSDPAWWMENYFYVEDPRDPITGEQFEPGPIILAEHQKRILRAALTKVRGLFPFTTIVYSTIKKSGKTRLAAGVAAWFAATQGKYNEVYCLANDGKQSADRILSAVRKSVELNPTLSWDVTKTRISLPNGTFVESIPCDPTGQAGSNPGLTVWCLDDKTEVLTQDGWKGIDEASDSDLYATLNKNRMFEWQHPYGIYRGKYVGDMLGAKSRGVDFLVTPEHRLYASQDGGHTWSKPDTQSVYGHALELQTSAPNYTGTLPGKKVKIPGSPMKGPFTIDLKLWVRFMAWFLSEGYVRKDGIIIAQSEGLKSDNFYEIVELIEDMGLRPVLEPVGNPHRITVYDSRLRNYLKKYGLSGDKYVPVWIKNLPADLLWMFLETYVKGDGHERQSGWQITTKSRRMADDLQEMAIKCGMHATIGPDAFGCYRIYISKHSASVVVCARDWYTQWYDGMVWCPSTPNGIVLARRNGRVAWTKNSEMWGYHHEYKERLWTEMTVPPTRYGRAFRWVESYAGYRGESHVLEQLYEIGVVHGRRHPLFPDIPVYINVPARMFTYWDEGEEARRMPWQTEEYYTEEAQLLVPAEFERIHMNHWAEPAEKAIPLAWWDRLEDIVIDGQRLPPIRSNEPLVLGVDASISHDCCAVTVHSRHPQRRKHTAIRGVYVWTPPRGGAMDYSTTIEPVIVDLCQRYNVVEVAYDKYQLHKMMTDLRKRGLTRFFQFEQTGRRALSDKQFYDKIVRREIVHNGDQTLRTHVDNAAAQTTSGKYRFVKMDTSQITGVTAKPIDALIAASMGDYECQRLNL